MAFRSSFEHEYQSTLPLPIPKPGQDAVENTQRCLDAALSILHDPEAVIDLSPIVVNRMPLPKESPEHLDISKFCEDFKFQPDPSLDYHDWQITERLGLLLGYHKDLTFVSAIARTVDGMESFTDAGTGVALHAKWSVKESDDRSALVLSETVLVRCNALLKWYIKSTMGASHNALHDGFKVKWMKLLEQ